MQIDPKTLRDGVAHPETLREDDHPGSDSLGLIWGAENIGAYVNTKPREAFYMLQKGLLPAWKVGRLWVSSKAALQKHFAA
jgi:hypothetical protein